MEDLIVSDENIMMGKPVIRGTRVTVESILEHLGGGASRISARPTPGLTRPPCAPAWFTRRGRFMRRFIIPIRPTLEMRLCR